MSLSPGQRLGTYEIVSALGAGGMGEVYRARDTKLQRDVAIKVIPEPLATDRDRLARFEREAQLLAALNHPHIAAIYGVDTAGETQFLVLELVEGDTLADRIARGGALGLREALAIARQIAEALQAAHDKGIVHRDLKPANIALTSDNQVKVLDFGLAKAIEGAPAAQSSVPGASLSPTLSLAMTEAGFILGTAAYMSPEQAKGRPADKRSDVWAFGCVLFEMLTGKRAFEGEDASDTLAGILRGEPDWKALPRSTPGYVRDVLTGCLAKDRKARLADIAVVNYLLSEPRYARQAPTPLLTRSRALAFGAVLLALVAVGVGGWRMVGRSDVAPWLMRFSIVPGPDDAIATTTTDRQLAIAPDGKHIVFVTSTGLALRPVDRLEIQRLSGDAFANARSPFWSPDGKWIGFAFGTNELRKVSVTGGPPVTLCRILNPPRGATWGPDDTIVFATADTSTGLMSVPAAGGDVKVLTKPDAARGESDHLFPAFLPGGQAVLFTITAGSADNTQIAVLNLETGQYKTLVRGGSHPEYVETGHIVYAVNGTLRAVRFDIDRLDAVGDPVPVLERVITHGNGAAEYALSRTGALVYMPGESGGTGVQRSLVWADRSGRETAIKGPPRAYQYPRLSPDGSKIAVALADQQSDIWVFDLSRGTLTPLTFDAGADTMPAWFPDGRRILFSSSRAGAMNLFWQQADGTGVAHQVTTGGNVKLVPTISPDGTTVALLEQFPKTGNDLSIVRVTTAAAAPGAARAPTAAESSGAQTTPLLQTAFTEVLPEISADGRWLAYVSNDSGQQQVYVQPFPDVNSGRWQLSVDGGSRPVWAPNGRELFYANRAGTIMAVPVGTGSTFTYGNATKLFDWPTIGVPGQFRTYDVSRDGQRFLMVKEAGGDRKDAPAATITVVLNWVEELKEKLPMK
jgi:serine/threonine-protein kinase